MKCPAWLPALLAAALLWPAAAPAAIDEDQLLPVDEAFALSARASGREQIALQWHIAEGYYLYRHRTQVQVQGEGFDAGPLALPAGTPYTDEFFGQVETYRQRLVATLPGSAHAGARSVTLQVKYQGCADIGICYPPQTRQLTVALPAADGDATPAGLAALGRSLQGGPASSIGLTPDGRSAPLPLPEAQAFAFEAIADGGNRVLMRFTAAPGYYLYQDRNRFAITGDARIQAGRPDWPAGQPHRDEHFGDVIVHFGQVDVPLPLHRQTADAATVTLTATFQGCQDEGICYPPMTRQVQLSLPAGTVDASPVPAPADAGTTPPDEAVPDPAAAGVAIDNVPGDADATAADTPPPLQAAAGDADGVAWRLALPALLLALLGGVLLNVMPCVLPILSLKVLGLAQAGGDRRRARSQALWYTAGVLVAFAAIGLLVLGLRASGQALGWGFQLQQAWFVAALGYLMFAVGLSLSGVFTLGAGLGNVGHALASRGGRMGDFATGLLACVVASPCVAPLMGAAVAYAFNAHPALALLVFVLLGLGMALPFLLIGLVPALADRLPKPGAWMETFKQVMALPMYLTAIWLLWVLGRQRGVDAMALVAAGLALFAFALWWYERKRWTGSVAARTLALLVLVATVLPVWLVARMPAPAAAAQAADHAWSPGRLQALRDEGRPVFVNVTADWCVPCKVNERAVLSRAAFGEAIEAAGATYLVADWTNVDPQITAFLESHGTPGVPLYLVYPRGGGAPERLPSLLALEPTLAAIGRAAQ